MINVILTLIIVIWFSRGDGCLGRWVWTGLFVASCRLPCCIAHEKSGDTCCFGKREKEKEEKGRKKGTQKRGRYPL